MDKKYRHRSNDEMGDRVMLSWMHMLQYKGLSKRSSWNDKVWVLPVQEYTWVPISKTLTKSMYQLARLVLNVHLYIMI